LFFSFLLHFLVFKHSCDQMVCSDSPQDSLLIRYAIKLIVAMFVFTRGKSRAAGDTCCDSTDHLISAEMVEWIISGAEGCTEKALGYIVSF